MTNIKYITEPINKKRNIGKMDHKPIHFLLKKFQSILSNLTHIQQQNH